MFNIPKEKNWPIPAYSGLLPTISLEPAENRSDPACLVRFPADQNAGRVVTGRPN